MPSTYSADKTYSQFYSQFTPSFAPSSESTRIALSRTEKLRNDSVDKGMVALNLNQSSSVFTGLIGTTDQEVTGSTPVGRAIYYLTKSH